MPVVISTGSPRFDALIGGGLARGRITTFLGEQDVGLSLVARWIARNAGLVLYMDAACKMTAARDGLYVCQETDLKTASKVISGGVDTFDLVIVDTAHDLDFAPDLPIGFDPDPAMQRNWREEMRTIGLAVSRSRTALLILVRKYPIIFPVMDRSSTVVEIERGQPINFGAERVGHWLSARRAPHPEPARIPFYYSRGFDPVQEARLRS